MLAGGLKNESPSGLTLTGIIVYIKQVTIRIVPNG